MNSNERKSSVDFSLQKKPQAKLKDLISKDELLHLLGDGLKKLNENEEQFNTDDKHTILIDSTKHSPGASNKPIKVPNRNTSPKKQASKTDSKIRKLKTFAKTNIVKQTAKNSSAKKIPATIVRDSISKKKLVNKVAPIKQSAPLRLTPVLRESNGESSEADSSGKLNQSQKYLYFFLSK